jgi:hypothetical protein
MDISTFKKQASEINAKLETVQQDLYQNMDIIQKHYQVINNFLKNIHEKEKESYTARSKFQEFIVWRQNINVPRVAPFSQFEQIKGEMDLKVWETNMEESKKLAREAKEAFLNTLSVVDLEMTELDGSAIPDTLGKIEIEKSKENSKKIRENAENAIQQLNQVNLQMVNDLLVKLSLQQQVTTQAVVKIQEKLPLIHKKVFAFELNVNVEPSKFVMALMELHAQFKDQKKPSSSASK